MHSTNVACFSECYRNPGRCLIKNVTERWINWKRISRRRGCGKVVNPKGFPRSRSDHLFHSPSRPQILARVRLFRAGPVRAIARRRLSRSDASIRELGAAASLTDRLGIVPGPVPEAGRIATSPSLQVQIRAMIERPSIRRRKDRAAYARCAAQSISWSSDNDA